MMGEAGGHGSQQALFACWVAPASNPGGNINGLKIRNNF
jgi:hypothetical protein